MLNFMEENKEEILMTECFIVVVEMIGSEECTLYTYTGITINSYCCIVSDKGVEY